VIPGTTIAGVAGFALLFAGIWQTYSTKGVMAGHLMLASTLVFTILALYFSFRAGTWKRLALKTTVDGKLDNPAGTSIQTGDTGSTLSRLAPSGKALINNDIVEVHTYGEFIDHEQEIQVISVKENKIIVTLKK
jgi:membrane-bound ClpP family serine protease